LEKIVQFKPDIDSKEDIQKINSDLKRRKLGLYKNRIRLKHPDQVRVALAQVFNDCRADILGTNKARTLAYVLGKLLESIEKIDQAEKLKELESEINILKRNK